VTAPITLDDKYTAAAGLAYMSGTQALVRLPMLQHVRDRAAGLSTAGFISGYRGSPLGGYDQALEKAKAHLDRHHITFMPGVNEELAATAVWGTQQANLKPGAKYDGVFGIWYGKGPGVDRSADAFRHANQAGTSANGGVLALAGDDHSAKSSTMAAQTDHLFQAVGMPVLAPATLQDVLDLGLHGFATGWARRPSWRPATCSRTWATAPTSTRATSPSARPWPRRRPSPTRSCSTTPSP
jgi:indolepyruvate ferredoxin oxidoreductase